MASPNATGNGKKFASTAGNTMGSTMANTQNFTKGLGSTGGQGTQNMMSRFNNTTSSPFRDIVARGMVTGVGFLGQAAN